MFDTPPRVLIGYHNTAASKAALNLNPFKDPFKNFDRVVAQLWMTRTYTGILTQHQDNPATFLWQNMRPRNSQSRQGVLFLHLYATYKDLKEHAAKQTKEKEAK